MTANHSRPAKENQDSKNEDESSHPNTRRDADSGSYSFAGEVFRWRLGQDGSLHAIKGCDPLASGWIAECGRFITGPETHHVKCQICVEKAK